MKFFSVLLIPFLISCGGAVMVDYEKSTQFLEYITYNIYPSVDSGLNELDDKRIINTIDSLFAQKGIQKSETPQFLVNFYTQEQINNSGTVIGLGVGGGGINGGGGVSGGIPIGGQRVDQQFTLDFVDAVSDELIWQGILVSNYKEKATPIEKEAYYFKILQKILKEYPPDSE